MGFGGGGGGGTVPHEHTLIPNDGGPLDFINTTIASLSQGSVTFSDGSALQELIAPAVPAGEVLTFPAAATAPSWQAGASATSVWEQLATTTALTSVGGFNVLKVSFSATLSDYSEIVGIANITPSANSYGWRVNDLAGTAYNYQISTVYSTGTEDNQGQTSQDMWKFGRYLVGVNAAQLEIHIQRNDNYGDYLTATGACAGDNGMCSAGGILNTDIDTMTSLSVCEEGVNLPAGELTVYGVRKS